MAFGWGRGRSFSARDAKQPGCAMFLGGSKGAVLDPPNAAPVLFWCNLAVPRTQLGLDRWCLAVSDPKVLFWNPPNEEEAPVPRAGVFGLSRLGCAMFLVYVLGLFSSS